jgi:putative hydrolase of the HAD superfamily
VAPLDAVTIDAFGTLVRLRDPTEALVRALAERGEAHDADEVAAAFLAEGRYYRPRSLRGRDAESLAALRLDCAGVFLRELRSALDAAAFVDAFMGSLAFDLEAGALEAVERLRAAGLRLAVVANWDMALPEWLQGLGVADRFEAIITSAEAGAAKPDPAPFLLALRRLGVEPARALHVGDEDADRDGAAAAGMRFEPVPLATMPERLGLE